MILRLLLAARYAPLLAEAHTLLAGEDLQVATAGDADAMWGRLRSRPCDLLVVSEDLLGAEPAAFASALAEQPGAPEWIVLLGRDDPGRRAALLEAGALACPAGDIERGTLFRTLRALVRRARRQAVRELMAGAASSCESLSDFASRSRAMQSLLATVRKLVDTGSSLLILGETGVGKEYLARAIHREGPRRESPFVAVNCTALSESLLESELFGHAAGAFTGATRAHRGFFELAHRGIVFLDEIGEMAGHLQAKLLRVLQDRIVQPVGSEKSVQVDVRVIAATNRDLRQELEAGRFRADLYYRLGVVTVTVPPLRERREDIPDLVASHLERFRTSLGRPPLRVSDEALALLLGYPWPGNVRELINVVERAVLLTEGEEIRPADLPEAIAACGSAAEDRTREPLPRGARLTDVPLHLARERVVADLERRYLVELLEATRGQVGLAAARAGITPRALYDKMKRLDLKRESFKRGPRVASGAQ